MNKKIRLLAVVFGLCIVLLGAISMTSSAATIVDSGECGENITWTLTDSGVLTLSGMGEMTNYSYRSAPWYEQCSSIQQVIIEDGITSIGNGAFTYCENLTSIEIPESVTSIGEGAFGACGSLTSITLPSGLTSIGDVAFSNCEGLTSITIPVGVTSIGRHTFNCCYSLTNITIPEGITSIGDNAFSSCKSLTNVSISEGVTRIGNDAFSNCKSLMCVTVPESLASIGDCAFTYCFELKYVAYGGGVTQKSEISMGKDNLQLSNANWVYGATEVLAQDGIYYVIYDTYAIVYDAEEELVAAKILQNVQGIPVTSIGDYAFRGCSSLNSVVIPEGVISIGYNAFRLCPLTKVTLPTSVTSIGSYAFFCASFLTTIRIPASVTSIGEFAFWCCSQLEKVYYSGTKEQWEAMHIGNSNDDLINTTIRYKPENLPKAIEITERLIGCNETRFTVDLTTEDCGMIIVARYGENGQYLGMNIYNVAYEIPVSVANDCEKVRVMWWDGFFTMRSLAPVVELDI